MKAKNEKKIVYLMESNNIKVTKKKIFKTSFTHFEGGNIYRVLKFMIIRRVYILFTNTKPFAETYCDNFYRILKQTQGQRNRGWGRVKSGANWHRKMCANRENNGYVNKEQSRGVEKNCLWFTTLFSEHRNTWWYTWKNVVSQVWPLWCVATRVFLIFFE